MTGVRRLQGNFGSVLMRFRKRAGMTQKQLAQRLSMHANTISSWELGSYLPESRGLVLELAWHLSLDEEETRELLEASLAGLAPYWGIPLRRNPFFTGREAVLETMHAYLVPDQAGGLIRSCAIHGLGGIGKTQTALEYAYRYAFSYSALLWIAAETNESIIASLLYIADLLQLPGRGEADQHRIVTAVHRWLSSHKEWLLICDNVEDFELLFRFLPPTYQGAILLTTRNPVLGTLARKIELMSMSQEEGMLFLLRRSGVLPTEATNSQMHNLAEYCTNVYTTTCELVRMMEGLPLALDQAGAYIDETGCSLMDYQQCYEKRRKQLLSQRGTPTGDHPRSVVATLLLAFRRIRQRSPVAFDFLCCCAFLSPKAIPEELFKSSVTSLGETLDLVAADPCQLDQAIAILRSLSLVQRFPETQTISLHNLVQVVLREELSEQEQMMWKKRIIAALNAIYPEPTHCDWKQCERLLPHVLLYATAMSDHLEDLELANVLWKTAAYLLIRVQYEQAQALYQRALHIREQALGPHHPLVAFPLNGLALLFSEQGKNEQGEALCQRALHIREQALGPHHPLVAQTLNNLAILYKNQGKYEQAERACLRALYIIEQAGEDKNPDIANTLNNLAILYFRQGKYAQAEPLYLRALQIWEQALGPEHPQIVAPLSNLTNLYREQRKYEKAQNVCQRALDIVEQAWGPQHPILAIPLANMASVYREQGKYEQAHALYQRVLDISEQALGPEHPNLAEPLTDQANIYREQGKYEQAYALYQRALQIREEHLGQRHPETAQTLYDLALLYEKQGHHKQARSLFQRTYTIFEQCLGKGHPETVKARADYQRSFARKRSTTRIMNDQLHTQEEEAWQAILPPLKISRGPCSRKTAGEEADPLTAFFTACCELHPQARCRASDLWRAYEEWVKDHQERFPLSRRAFSRQLQIHGLQAERTNRERLWRGIELLKEVRDMK
ncbi:tetratricopeptide repeat protein [Ktedonosporobacter rubrisoli]|uniref:Tetratricopeptide repeat protein n=1 Tax=Ktedonosporobacter rubrisoli TaxID=2509675 RepID=A0A4P6K4J3_KTERU|nr:FxSxx-COOH system tetratricopeptide repeat protein [Ktedonosporobacter rubrisoli]QBD82882.1 tetratricopeptide repeat protein [Ktedonosporobacter rubrisoli]